MKKAFILCCWACFVMASSLAFASGRPAAINADDPAARAPSPKQVCSEKDFMAFIAVFSELAALQQAVCARFPLKIQGKTHTTQESFLSSSAAGTKFIISRNDAEKSGKTAKSFFFQRPPDGNVLGAANAGEYLYIIIAEHENKRAASLTEGGTFQFSTVEFLWNGEQWKIIEVRERL